MSHPVAQLFLDMGRGRENLSSFIMNLFRSIGAWRLHLGTGVEYHPPSSFNNTQFEIEVT